MRYERRARQHLGQIWRYCGGFDEADPIVIEHRYFAERITGQMLGLAGLALEHVHRHLFVVRALLGEQHPDGPDIRTAVKTVEDDPSHLISLLLGFRATAEIASLRQEAHLCGLVRRFGWSENARCAVISIPRCETVNGFHSRD